MNCSKALCEADNDLGVEKAIVRITQGEHPRDTNVGPVAQFRVASDGGEGVVELILRVSKVVSGIPPDP